jgi:endonuclease/exonuclease/phosphatase family metal-dependent hydrolase
VVTNSNTTTTCLEGLMSRTRWRITTGITAVAALLALGSLSPSASALPERSATDYHPGRIATFNACNPCDITPGTNAAAIAAYIDKHRPQVIGLQEVCVRDVDLVQVYLEGVYGLTYHRRNGSVLEHLGRCGGTPWDPGNYGNAILSATPLTDTRDGEYPDGGSEDRGYVYGTTEIHGVDTRVVVTHLAQGDQSAVRADQVWHLLNEVNPDPVDLPVVAIGDFNATPRAEELLPMWFPFREADPGCTQAGATYCKATSPGSGKKLDYIWVERERMEPPGVVVTDTFSDHHAVYADLPR